MTSPFPSSSKPRRLSPFFRDLASPIALHNHPHRSTTTTTPTTRLSSSRDESSPPPPPAFTLDDRPDLSPLDLPPSPRSPSPSTIHRRPSLSPNSSFSMRSRVDGSGGGGGGVVVNEKSPERSTSWMATLRIGRDEEREGSPVDGIVEKSVVLQEVSRFELPENGAGSGEAWVTLFGFAPGDTNLVLREFEKCGVILKHIPGPKDSNWTHILYQNHYDARMALEKNGICLSSLLVVGVKSVDPVHKRLLSDMVNNSHRVGFIPSKMGTQHSSSGTHPHTGSSAVTDSGRRPTGAIAAPARSVVSKVMDLMFGM